ncbi:2-phospho-L-lactate guanylyltransferase [Agromyces sp. GXQ0307]|uniref:2-phospho-L-lactate guanylyltransferase n=1 Tax=Agromyces sp. GXQ0307 TaxID=3377835 RepID=UPI00383AC5F7
MSARPDLPGWIVVVPVKSLTGAKTRLAPELGPAERAALARAFALDTIDAARAARAVRRVLVVSDEPVVERGLRGAAGVDVVPEFGPRGLAAAIAHGIAVARADPGRAVAVLLGDLPAMRPDDLDAALDAAARHPLAFVADAEGTGTTLATALDEVPFAAHFGPDSAARHRATGFADLVALDPPAIAPGLRRDVDTAGELREAIALGVHARTAEVVRGLGDRLDLADGVAPRHPLDPSTAPTGAATAPHGADRKAAS